MFETSLSASTLLGAIMMLVLLLWLGFCLVGTIFVGRQRRVVQDVSYRTASESTSLGGAMAMATAMEIEQ